MIANCSYCTKPFEISAGHYNRAMKRGLRVHCNRTCAGLNRRKEKTIEQKKAEKAEYDRLYAEKNRDILKEKRHEYHKRTYDPVKAAAYRKGRMHKHLEIMRRPKWKEYKKKYDKIRQAKLMAGELWEAKIALVELEKELDSKQIKYDNGIINKSQKRKRQWKS